MTGYLLSPGSYIGIFVLMVLTGAGLPIPEEVFIFGAGILCSHGQLNHPWLALAALLAGGLAGDCLMYSIGRRFGRSVLREHRWWAHFVTAEREAKMEAMLQKHGLKVLFLARFLVGLRSPVYLSAGILRVPFRRFLLFDLLCATVVIGVFFQLSFFFGKTITDSIRDTQIVVTVIVALVLVAGALYYWRHRHRKRVEAAPKPTENLSPQPDHLKEPVGKEVEQVA